MNIWKITTIILFLLIMGLVTYLEFGIIKENYKFGDFVIEKKSFENIVQPIANNRVFILCDIKKDQCIQLQKNERT